jgi:S-(hydroxymethyl)glutathione dehydrogenase / alcohol dehydrogenase
VLFLSDILPTGYFGVDIANVQPGDDVAVFGVRIKKETNGRGAICIDAVGYEAVGHVGGDGSNNKGHDHSRVSNPAYEPANLYR